MAQSRRTLLGDSLAVAAATLVTPSPDAVLIGLCARYIEADRCYFAHTAEQAKVGDGSKAEWDRLDTLVTAAGAVMMTLEPQISALAATSPAGTQAKAAAVSLVTSNYKDPHASQMLRSLLADLQPVKEG